MKDAFHKAIILPCICCISFYTGVQLVGETEASFSRQASIDSVEMSAAFVFPSTIKQLENKAQSIAASIYNKYESISPYSPDSSLQELQENQFAIIQTDQDLAHLLNELESVHFELSSHSQQALEIQDYDFVHKGYKNVDSLIKEVRTKIDFQYLATILSSIRSQIKDLEDKAMKDKESTSGDLIVEEIKNEDEKALEKQQPQEEESTPRDLVESEIKNGDEKAMEEQGAQNEESTPSDLVEGEVMNEDEKNTDGSL
ncbi:DUF4047 domain-containing protein [Peribacillus acanthi]|uniref:DUF4047 domain-containing protein n=1 Tax=Peribacillus acanthi TaxID=2171554 RepID=UPI000D3E58BB|nr:DUF4047 domain-containing protein [Peribacillus acanthi]